MREGDKAEVGTAETVVVEVDLAKEIQVLLDLAELEEEERLEDNF
jgi:hypothetical protein